MNSQLPSPTELWEMFQAVDTDHDGEIDKDELQVVLSNGTNLPFNLDSITLMIKMFDRMGHGKLHYDQFGSLWKYVQDWQSCFSRFDVDGSGRIDMNELHSALTTFGYRLSPQVVGLLVAKYDRHGKGTLAFDDFIQSCIMLHTITDLFKSFDHNQDGWITINYEQFMALVMRIPERES